MEFRGIVIKRKEFRTAPKVMVWVNEWMLVLKRENNLGELNLLTRREVVTCLFFPELPFAGEFYGNILFIIIELGRGLNSKDQVM